MDRAGVSNDKRFPSQKNAAGRWMCRMCSKPVELPKRSFCGPRCLRDFFMNTDWARVRRVIYERDGGMCMKCGQRVPEKNYHIDHIVPLSRGGDEWALNNLELSCPPCNMRKGADLEGIDDDEWDPLLP
jgi:5-methylcytosine-specific restriction endonuclease McrA